MIRLYINDQLCEAEEGSMIIEVADRIGVHIPRFCYHPELSIAANCRMCFVETSASPKLVPACATPVSDGLRVMTQSEKIQNSQSAVLEFLLINHPLDCPVCDQGGECELQDLTLQHAHSHSAYREEKRQVSNPDLGPLVATEMNRCIHCTRCVRFGTEIAGKKEMGAIGRGEHTLITNSLAGQLDSPVSSNIIDICPVGALTSKPRKYSGRTWEYQSYPGVTFHDGSRSRVQWHMKNRKIMRATNMSEPGDSDYWLSDRDRFGFLGVENLERFDRPLRWTGDDWSLIEPNTISEWLYAITGAVKTVVHPMVCREDRSAIQLFLDRFFGSRADLMMEGSGRVLLDYGFQTQWPYETGNNILLIGPNFEVDHPLVVLQLRKISKNSSVKLTHLTFFAEPLHIPGVQQVIIPQEQWADWIEKFIAQNQQLQVFWSVESVVTLVSTLSQVLSQIAERCCLLGGQGPFDASLFHRSSATVHSKNVQIVITVGLESYDWNSDENVYQAIHEADVVLSFTPHQFQRGVHSGHILIPITTPFEQDSSYLSFWNSGELLQQNKIVDPDPGIQTVREWLNFFLDHRATAVRPESLFEGSSQRTVTFPHDQLSHEFDRHSITIFRHPASTDLICRRSRALNSTKWALDRNAIWISQELFDHWKGDGRHLCITNDYGQKYDGNLKISSQLTGKQILIWTGHVDQKDQPFFSDQWTVMKERG